MHTSLSLSFPKIIPGIAGYPGLLVKKKDSMYPVKSDT